MINNKRLLRTLFNVRIAWFIFLLIVSNPLVKSLLNPQFNWIDMASLGHIIRQPILFILIILFLGLGLAVPLGVHHFFKNQSKVNQYLITFVIQSGLFLCVPILGFSIALQEANPSLVFLYSIIGILLLTLTFPTRKRWKLTTAEEQEFNLKANTPVNKKSAQIKRIIAGVIFSLIGLKIVFNFIQSQSAAKTSTEQCRKDCFDLFNQGDLQPGFSAEKCIEKSCK
ncbi:MAG: hypothetical protein H7235_01075 [Bdellovibrionaceae bacterium]|nr:hypothetical protein [Pseudobdellovibrionaceae bacterium]